MSSNKGHVLSEVICQKLSSYQKLSSSKGHILSSIKGCPPKTVNIHQMSSSSIFSTVNFHHRSSSIERHLPSKDVFHQSLSSNKGQLPSKVIFHQRSSSINIHLPLMVIFHQRLSSIKGCLQVKCMHKSVQVCNGITGTDYFSDVFR